MPHLTADPIDISLLLEYLPPEIVIRIFEYLHLNHVKELLTYPPTYEVAFNKYYSSIWVTSDPFIEQNRNGYSLFLKIKQFSPLFKPNHPLDGALSENPKIIHQTNERRKPMNNHLRKLPVRKLFLDLYGIHQRLVSGRGPILEEPEVTEAFPVLEGNAASRVNRWYAPVSPVPFGTIDVDAYFPNTLRHLLADVYYYHCLMQDIPYELVTHGSNVYYGFRLPDLYFPRHLRKLFLLGNGPVQLPRVNFSTYGTLRELRLINISFGGCRASYKDSEASMVVFPPGLERLSIMSNPQLTGLASLQALPKFLKSLTIKDNHLPCLTLADSQVLPPGLESLSLESNGIAFLSDFKFPAGLKELVLHYNCITSFMDGVEFPERMETLDVDDYGLYQEYLDSRCEVAE
ncbi:hypothetical protein BABINDRAFT_9678 [Babjeviella inositovora NRRL Y-12698]|uniref:F-box domain-containing protein n=1 Tax=Babjeviella inositovora NRRL Y-12698 TaxID=984486 RepID=A0A1E3QK68_9ASCO|nr:uncharacterized protein BABINDRAFT_9678 [Babjeviella inositovora NRRL Y-12698]ODQ78075.1 hypothetical protein BABINDRAFT_9678 [Babjeviella inositovora NRRL Y-12698]